MEITGKQVRQLRSLAHHLDPALIVGKNGITSATLKQLGESLDAHELVKVSVSENSGLDVKTAAYELADALEAEVIQTIGKRVVLYRESPREDIDHIELD